jgi:hypothetical protein
MYYISAKKKTGGAHIILNVNVQIILFILVQIMH